MDFSLIFYGFVCMVVVVAGGCRGDLGFCFIWVLGYIILLCRNIILMYYIVK